MTEAGHAELAAWLAEDRRNRGAYLRAQAALLAMETAVREGPRPLVSGNDAEYGPVPVVARARWPMRFAMAAGIAAVGLLGLAALVRPWQAPVAAPEQTEVMTLQDGSVVTLGQGGQVRVELDGELRRIVLLSGTATFQVAADETRPFVVSSGQVSAQATGTVYSVSRVGGLGATVDVAEGSVLVWEGEASSQAVLLRAGGKLTLDPGIAPAGMSSRAAAVAQISLDNEPIVEAVERFNRVNRTQIVVADPAIGQVRIVGLFRADDPEQFARAAAAIAGAEVVQRNDAIVIGAR